MSFIQEPSLQTTDEGIYAALSSTADEVLNSDQLYRGLPDGDNFEKIMNAIGTLKGDVFKCAWENGPTRYDIDQDPSVTSAKDSLVETIKEVHSLDERQAQEAVDNYYRALVNFIHGVSTKAIDTYLGGLEWAANQAHTRG